jgi:hypothetical protein
MTQEALKLALEALEDALNKPMWNRPQMTTAITDIKEALAEHAMQDVQRLGQEIEQEPVAFWNFNSGFSHCMIDQLNEAAKKNPAPLYTTPPQRKPLTDEEIFVIKHNWITTPFVDHLDFARAIEAAHDIKENT